MSVNMGDIPVDELMHYGVKGMKWGVRRDNPSGSSSTKSLKAKTYASKGAESIARAGAQNVGWIIGSELGRATLGSGIGQTAGGLIGSQIAGRRFDKALNKAKRSEWSKSANNLSKSLPNRHEGYSPESAKKDMMSFGPTGAKRINESIRSGKTHREALQAENRFQRNSTLVIVGVGTTASLMRNPVVTGTAANLKQMGYSKAWQAGANRNAARATRNAVPSNALPVGMRMAPRNRRGVQRVTTL